MDGTLGNIIFTICTMLFILSSVVLVLVILVQKPQGGGLSAAFGGGGASSQSAFGAKTGDMLTMGTVGVFVFFLAISITLVLMTAGRYDKTAANLPPEKPENLLVEAPNATTVHLTWDDKSDNEDQFKIERSESKDGPWTSVGSVNENEEKYTDSSVHARTTYYYRVSAVNANGPSDPTDVVSAETPEVAAVPDKNEESSQGDGKVDSSDKKDGSEADTSGTKDDAGTDTSDGQGG